MNPTKYHNAATTKFSELLRKFRQRADKTFLKLSSEIGVDPSYLSRIEAGTRQPPQRDIVIRLGDALGLSPQEKDSFLISASYAPLYPEDIAKQENGLELLETHPTLRLLAEVIRDDEVDKNDIELIESVLKNIKKRNDQKRV